MLKVYFDIELEPGHDVSVYGEYYQGTTEPGGDDPSEFDIDRVTLMKTGESYTLTAEEEKLVRKYFCEDYEFE